MKTNDLKWLADGSEALDEALTREYGEPEPPEAPDAFEMPHPRENRYYRLVHNWTNRRGEKLVNRLYSAYIPEEFQYSHFSVSLPRHIFWKKPCGAYRNRMQY